MNTRTAFSAMSMSATCTLACLAAMPAGANDTMAELVAGGLNFVQTDAVSMVEEDLYISPERVTVDYVFRNTSDRQVTSYIAFPMPDIKGHYESEIALNDREADNFLGFTVTQDGQPIQPNLQQRVIATGIDMTDEVRGQDVPLLPFSDRTHEALAKLPSDVLEDWRARGLIYDDVYEDAGEMKHHPIPLWTLQSAYWWKTTFPAGQDVRVHHEYSPGVGGTAGISFAGEEFKGDDWFDKNQREYRQKYCIDDSFMRLADKLQKDMSAGTGPYYTESWISYVLKTGANWAGPIGKLRITIDKGDKANFVSFCGNGVKKTGPTTFEMNAVDFMPEQDIHVLLLVRAQSEN